MFSKFRIRSAILILLLVFSAVAETLFQIKDESGNPVLVVSTDGLRILNGADTLMVISSSEIKANIIEDTGKGLSRSFSVSTTTSKGSSGNVMNVTTDGLDIVGQSTSKLLGDTLMTISTKKINARIPPSGGKGLSRSFSVSTTTSKGDDTNVLEVMTDNTVMTEGVTGDDYIDFSPENLFLGINAGAGNTTGTSNCYMGNSAGITNTTGTQNVMIGESAGKYYSGSFGNVFIGKDAAVNLASGQRNVVIGYSAGEQAPLSTNETYGNVFIGAVAGQRASGSHNVMIGEESGSNITSGSTGSSNVFLGYESGRYNSGSYNVCLGDKAGIGLFDNPITGSSNILIGRGVEPTNHADSYRLAIGSSYGDLLYGQLDGAKKLVVNGNLDDNTNGRTFYVNGSAGGTTVWNNDSDERLKKNISTINGALDRVMKLRGVTYEWKDVEKYEKGRRMGFIAQESKGIIPEAVDYDSANDRYTMQYSTVTALLVEAVKDLKNQVDYNVAAFEAKESENKKIINGQTEKINILINENKDLKNKVQELESLRAEINQIKRQIAGYTSK